MLLCSEPRRRSGEARPTSVQPGRTTTVTTVADIFCPIVHWQALRHEGNLCAPTAAADVASDPPHLVRPELADRLEVGTRTVRRAITLRTATSSNVTGIGETALRALIKLEQLLPSRLRHRVNALQISTVRTPGGGSAVDLEVLTAIGTACRDHERLQFDFLGLGGTTSLHVTEPHELLTWGGRWYLLAWDLERIDWRTFPVDRIRPRTPAGRRFTPRELPAGDAAAHVARSVAQMWPLSRMIAGHGSVVCPAPKPGK